MHITSHTGRFKNKQTNKKSMYYTWASTQSSVRPMSTDHTHRQRYTHTHTETHTGHTQTELAPDRARTQGKAHIHTETRTHRHTHTEPHTPPGGLLAENQLPDVYPCASCTEFSTNSSLILPCLPLDQSAQLSESIS